MTLIERARAALTTRPAGQNLRLVVEKTPTQTVENWQAKEAEMCSMFGCTRVRVDEIDSRHVAVNLFYGSPLESGMSTDDFAALLAENRSWRNCVIGVNEDGDPQTVDLVTLPHMLVGGTTNAGKSVLVNTAIASLIMSRESANLVLVDPKKVEFVDWAPAASAHAVEDSSMVDALTTAVELMDRRYRYLAHHGFKTVWDDPITLEALGGPVLVAVDELADLLDGCGKDAGTPVARLAQKGRAAGIHLLLATQNPRADLFGKPHGTQTLKANLPARIALRTGTTSESNIILGDGTSGPSSGADASEIPESMPGAAVDKAGRWFRCPHLTGDFIERVTLARSSLPLADLLSRAELPYGTATD